MTNKTPWNPSKSAIKRVKDTLPIPESCNRCGSNFVVIANNSEIYGRPYGKWPWIYICQDCEARVGMHPFTNIPLGTLADLETREARKSAKSAFYVLKNKQDWNRSQAYYWLAERIGIDVSECHFGWFEVDRCNKAKDICIKALKYGDNYDHE